MTGSLSKADSILERMQRNVSVDTDCGADVRPTVKPNRSVSIEVDDDNSKDKLHTTHEEQPGAQWL